MRAITLSTLRTFAIFLLLAIAPMAQAQDLPQDLTSISPAEALALNTGRLYRFSSWPNNPPLPPGVLLTDPAIGEDGSGLATNVFYSASLAAVFWDDRESLAEQMLIEAAANGNHQMFQQEQQGEELGAQGPYGTNDFWLEPVSVGSNLFNAFLHSTTNGSTYLITSTEAIDPVTNSVWQVEGSLQGGTNDATPFALGIALRTNNLFIAAQACDECATNTLPLWWQLAYFGVTGVDPNGDYDCDGVSNLLEFLNSTDPNKIVFSLSVTNEYVPTTAVPVQVNIASGVPSYLAVLLNDDSPGNATWQPFTSTSLSVALPTNGTYVITVGLCGLATNATQSWQSLRVFRDTTPLTLAITNLPALSGSRPFIDPAGYTTRALSALTWTVVDANGATNAGTGMVVDQGWSLSDSYHVTNWFQCVDLPLALGTNWISIQAVDWAGTAAVTNFTYVFDTNGDTTAPALTLTWPQDGTQVSGDSFTVQAWMDDDTAAVALQYTDGDGILQTLSGRVERGGRVWVTGVPLAAGANSASLLTTDAAGNVSTNNLTVVRSSMQFTINPLSQDQMKYGYATVAGTVEDPNCTVTVNGLTATNNSGSWQVDNVPLPPGGTVILQAIAHLAGGTNVQALLTQERGPIVFTQTYGYKLDYTFSPSTNSFEGHHFELQWARGVGGTNTETSWTVDPEGNVSSNLFIAIWPPDNGYWPMLEAQTSSRSYSNGVLIASTAWTADPPSVEWMEKSTSAGSWPDYFQASWTESSAREVRLFTGGNASRQSQGLFDLSASLNRETELDQRVYDWSVLYWPQAFTSFLSPASPPLGVPPQDIALGSLGNLGNDGRLWTLQTAGMETVITERAPETSYSGALASAQKYKLKISLNGDITDRTSTVYVGQEMSPICLLEPDSGPAINNYEWHIPGTYVGGYLHSAVLGENQPANLTNQVAIYYWADKLDAGDVTCTVKTGGKEWSAKSTFRVLKPTARWTGVTNGSIGVDGGYLHYGRNDSLSNAGAIFAFTNANVMGYTKDYSFVCAQVGNMQIVADGTNSAGAAYTVQLLGIGLDNGWPYQNFGKTNYVPPATDSPRVEAGPNPAIQPIASMGNLKITYGLSHYLFFQPAGPSIPVAIKRIDWSLSMQATNSGASTSVDGLVPADCSASILSDDVPVTGNPEWTNLLQNVSTNITAH